MHINEKDLKNDTPDEWKDWLTSTYNDTIESVEVIDTESISKYINKIKYNIENNTSKYSKEYLDECLMYIELILNGSYVYIDLLENIGAFYPHKEGFIECLKRLAETQD